MASRPLSGRRELALACAFLLFALATVLLRTRALPPLGGVRLSMHPGQFCVIASANPSAVANGVAEFEYHVEVMDLMGYGKGWHPHGAHINIHGGAKAVGNAVNETVVYAFMALFVINVVVTAIGIQMTTGSH